MKNILVYANPKSGVTSFICSKLKKANEHVELLEESLTVTDFFKRSQKVTVHRTISSLSNSIDRLDDKPTKVIVDHINMLTSANIKQLVNIMEKASNKNISFIIVASIGCKEAKKSIAFLKQIHESTVSFDTDYTFERDGKSSVIKDADSKVIKDITDIVKDGFRPILR